MPPVKDVVKLQAELDLVREADRDDAVQEAWLAHLEGRDAIAAVKLMAVRECRYRKLGYVCTTKDGVQAVDRRRNSSDEPDLADQIEYINDHADQ